MKTVYVHHLDCGHASWTSTTATTGVRWCPTCQAQVAVQVQARQKDSPTRRRRR